MQFFYILDNNIKKRNYIIIIINNYYMSVKIRIPVFCNKKTKDKIVYFKTIASIIVQNNPRTTIFDNRLLGGSSDAVISRIGIDSI